MQSKIKKTKFRDIFISENNIFKDNRGYFCEIFNIKDKNFKKFQIKQINISKSLKKNTFRGLHFQKGKNSQGKILTVIKGSIFDYILCLKKKDHNFGKLIKVQLDDKKSNSIFVPKGYAHGFLTLENNTIVSYCVDKNYCKQSESGINIYDKSIKIRLPKKITISKKDKFLPFFDKNKRYFL